jgi:hypothetical protein
MCSQEAPCYTRWISDIDRLGLAQAVTVSLGRDEHFSLTFPSAWDALREQRGLVAMDVDVPVRDFHQWPEESDLHDNCDGCVTCYWTSGASSSHS